MTKLQHLYCILPAFICLATAAKLGNIDTAPLDDSIPENPLAVPNREYVDIENIPSNIDKRNFLEQTYDPTSYTRTKRGEDSEDNDDDVGYQQREHNEGGVQLQQHDKQHGEQSQHQGQQHDGQSHHQGQQHDGQSHHEGPSPGKQHEAPSPGKQHEGPGKGKQHDVEYTSHGVDVTQFKPHTFEHHEHHNKHLEHHKHHKSSMGLYVYISSIVDHKGEVNKTTVHHSTVHHSGNGTVYEILPPCHLKFYQDWYVCCHLSDSTKASACDTCLKVLTKCKSKTEPPPTKAPFVPSGNVTAPTTAPKTETTVKPISKDKTSKTKQKSAKTP